MRGVPEQQSTCALLPALCESVLLSCSEPVLLTCSNSPSWPSRSRCRVSAAQHHTIGSHRQPCCAQMPRLRCNTHHRSSTSLVLPHRAVTHVECIDSSEHYHLHRFSRQQLHSLHCQQLKQTVVARSSTSKALKHSSVDGLQTTLLRLHTLRSYKSKPQERMPLVSRTGGRASHALFGMRCKPCLLSRLRSCRTRDCPLHCNWTANFTAGPLPDSGALPCSQGHSSFTYLYLSLEKKRQVQREAGCAAVATVVIELLINSIVADLHSWSLERFLHAPQSRNQGK